MRSPAITLLVAFFLLLQAPIAEAAAPFQVPPGKASYEFFCDSWVPEEPQTRWILLDVCMCSYDGGLPYGSPTESQREAIRALGGKIIYEFNVPFIRAKMPVSRVPDLDYWCWVESVDRPQSHVVEVVIGFEEELSEEERDYLHSLGVEILGELGSRPTILANVPDASIPAIRAMANHRFLEPNFRICPLGIPGEPAWKIRMEVWDGFRPKSDPHPARTWGGMKAHYR